MRYVILLKWHGKLNKDLVEINKQRRCAMPPTNMIKFQTRHF